MINTEKIIINVSPEIAKAYEQVPLAEKEQIQSKIATLISLYLQQKDNLAKFRQTMNLASQEVAAQGLTPEILDYILSEDV